MRLVTVDEMRALERRTFEAGIDEPALMENAGRAVAEALGAWLPRTHDRRLLVLAGKGNNGGDALIAARHLHRRFGMAPRIYLVADRGADPLLEWTRDAGVEVAVHGVAPAETLAAWLESSDVVLDGVLGIGQRLPLGGAVADVVAACRRHGAPGQRRVAVDVPTGVQADTGEAGDDAFRAGLTLATGPAKPGLFIYPGAAFGGVVQALDIGLHDPAEGTLFRTTDRAAARLLPRRRDDSHKGTFGTLLVIAGSNRYIGAAYLTAAAAVRAGTGLVSCAVPRHVQAALAASSPETTYLPLPDDPAAPGCITPGHLGMLLDAAAGVDAVAIGPGLGADGETRRAVCLFLERLAENAASPPVLIDADALNALAAAGQWPAPDTVRWVLTPHPGEMARLTGQDVRTVQSDRLGLARSKAREWQQVVVLKGAPSIIAAPDGRAHLNAYANAALATAGTGDVLSGVVAGLLAQGVAPYDAAVAGSYVHGRAGELWRAQHGPAGLPASALFEHVPEALAQLHHLR